MLKVNYPLVSVIIATHNRASMLQRALESLISQSLPADQYEVIVVDNASSDETKTTVEQYSQCGTIVRYVYEPNLGSSHAMNRGAKEAHSDILAFIDDDAKATTKWLETALRCFEEVYPKPIAIGGPILPLYDAIKPGWFEDKYEICTWGEQPRFLKRDESFYGSNMIFNKNALEMYGYFDVTIGGKGNIVSLGEDIEMFMRIWRSNASANLYYSPDLVVYHSVPDHKMTISYRLKRSFSVGQAWYLLHKPKSFYKRLRLLLWTVFNIVKVCCRALKLRSKYPAYQNWIVEEYSPLTRAIGLLAGCLGFTIKIKVKTNL